MKKIYFALTMLTLSVTALAQTVSIGTDLTQPSGSQYRSPWSPLYGYSYVQTIYLQSEINTAGSISSIKFNYSGASLANSDVVTVWMGTIARAEFSSASDWEPVANLTRVFQGQVLYTTLPGTVTINLTTPYNYQNTGNLVIAIDENTDGFSAGSSFYTTAMGETLRTIYFNDDDAANNPDPASPPDADGRRSRVANIQIGFGTLPVTLGNFSGESSGGANKLSWITYSEQKNKGFELQRSADGTSFTSVGFVTSKAPGGTSSTNVTYNFNDVKILRGNNYYRLKQLDFDGKATYSKVVVLKGSTKGGLSVVYPNPTKNEVNMILTSRSDDKATVYITNVSGKVVFKTTKSIATGDNKINVNVSGFAAGVYTVKAVYASNNISAISKFVKQ